MLSPAPSCIFFFFNDTATTEIYTLSLHDALPISVDHNVPTTDRSLPITDPIAAKQIETLRNNCRDFSIPLFDIDKGNADRKSTRLNSSHGYISYAVFCLKKKKKATI